MAMLMSSIFLLIVVGISYLLSKTIFVYPASASGVTLLINWIIIAVTHLRFRKKHQENFGAGKLRYLGFPYITITAIVLLLVVLCTSALSMNQLVGLAAGIIILLLLAGLYFALVKIRQHFPRCNP